ncbi:MAG: acyl-CoA synthetase [Microbacteriaceae bacterium]|nr:acyl-CoA synthetase [Microbacteriaceae bacterium]
MDNTAIITGQDSTKPTARSLSELLLHPRSVAIIGASTNPEALGGRPLGFLTSHGYPGAIYPINANHQTVQGVPALASILDVPEPVDVAMVAVRAELVPAVLRDCAKVGVGVAIVISSGFGEGMGAGADLAESVKEIIATSDMRVLGPNCEGIASLPASAPVTFSPVLDLHRTGPRLADGHIAVISQSGGVGFAVAQWGSMVGLGFSYIITTGNELDIDAVELAEGLVDDDHTTAIVMVMEGVRDLARFRTLALNARAAGKHLIVAKLGSTEPGSVAALAHTGHSSGIAADYTKVFEETGVLCPGDMDELIDVLQAVVKSRPAAGRRIGVMTTSGGSGVWLADAFIHAGFEIPQLSQATRDELVSLMPGYGSPINPVDLTAQFLAGGSFAVPLGVMVDSGEVDIVILATSLSAAGRLSGDREALEQLVARSTIPIAIYTYTSPAPSSEEILNSLDVPWYTSSSRAARGLAALLPREGS